MIRPRSINIFLLEGDPNGIRVAQISMSTIQAIAFRRNQFGQARKQFREVSRPGVYILLGPDEERTDGWLAYIGESESVGERLNYHSSNEKGRDAKVFWVDTMVLVSKDENLTKSHARYIEARLIAEAGRNPRWTLKNTQKAGEEGKLPLPERAAMDEFVDQTITLVGALGCDLFRAVRGALPSESSDALISSDAAIARTSDSLVFHFRGEGFSAQMVISATGEFIVRKGSKARVKTTLTIPAGALNLRRILVEKGILRDQNGSLEFLSDYTFSSVSAAAALVYGGSSNGRIAWQLRDGRNYAAWEADQVNAGADRKAT